MGLKYNPLTGQFDLVGSSSGGGGGPITLVKYQGLFSVANWTLVDNAYEYTVTAATHSKTDPIVHVYEQDGSEYIEINVTKITDISGNIKLQVSAVPDNRFNGLVLIF